MRILLLLPFFLFSIFVAGKGYTPDNLPLNTSGELTYICNPDKILSPTTVDSLNSMLYSLEINKGVKTLVITIKDIENDDPYDMAIKVGNKSGVGSKQNTGLIVVLATEDRCYYILTGEGLEKHLPDAICKRVENRVMVPLLKQGKWNEAMVETISALKTVLEDENELKRELNENEEENFFLIMFAIFIIILPVVLLIIVVMNERKCGHCGKYKLKVKDKKAYTDSNGIRHIQIVYECNNCKRLTVKEKTDANDNDHRLGGGGTFVGGIPFGRGHNSGGSFGGGFGSFGGGSFGGGGAGGRF